MPTIKFKRGTETQIDSVTLEVGEPAFSTDTDKLFIGTATGKQEFAKAPHGNESHNPDFLAVDGSTEMQAPIKQVTGNLKQYIGYTIPHREVGGGTYGGYLLLAKAHPGGDEKVEDSEVQGVFVFSRGSTYQGNRTDVFWVHSKSAYSDEYLVVHDLLGKGTYFVKTCKVTYNGTEYHAIKLPQTGGQPSNVISFTGYATTNVPLEVVRDTEVSGEVDFGHIGVFTDANGNVGIGTKSPSEKLHVAGNLRVDGQATVNGNTVWHAGNDGSGSGLDADLLDGKHASGFLAVDGSNAMQADLNMNGHDINNVGNDSDFLRYGTFTVGGSSNQFYPVQFRNEARGGTSTSSRLQIYRPNTHQDGSWYGTFNFIISFHPTNWGHFGNQIEWILYQTGSGGPYNDPVGDVADGSTASSGRDLIVWLRGGATYHWRNLEPTGRWTLLNGNPDGTSITDSSGNTRNPISSQSSLIQKAKNRLYFNAIRLGIEGDPTNAQDAATKAYVDNKVSSITVPDGSVSQSKLKTSIGSVSTGELWIEGGILLTLPGGQYGFYPQVKISASNYGHAVATITYGETDIKILGATNTSYATRIRLGVTVGTIGAGTAYARQRYVTSSGEVFWIFLLRDKETGEILAGYQAPDHPCFGNGNDPILVPHPFCDYDPERHEIIVINPTSEQLREMKALCRPRQLGQPKRDLLELFLGWQEGEKRIGPFYEPDDSVELEYPRKEITVGIVEDEDDKPLWLKEEAKVIKVDISKYQPDYVKVRPLKRINFTDLKGI
ncbi:MAG: hypothetical protein DRO12_05540 [Thermoprotei archaeon]|nr:MAG: hypothetical protein DRO12_05540 [Thermoprotei archaeon]